MLFTVETPNLGVFIERYQSFGSFDSQNRVAIPPIMAYPDGSAMFSSGIADYYLEGQTSTASRSAKLERTPVTQPPRLPLLRVPSQPFQLPKKKPNQAQSPPPTPDQKVLPVASVTPATVAAKTAVLPPASTPAAPAVTATTTITPPSTAATAAPTVESIAQTSAASRAMPVGVHDYVGYVPVALCGAASAISGTTRSIYGYLSASFWRSSSPQSQSQPQSEPQPQPAKLQPQPQIDVEVSTPVLSQSPVSVSVSPSSSALSQASQSSPMLVLSSQAQSHKSDHDREAAHARNHEPQSPPHETHKASGTSRQHDQQTTDDVVRPVSTAPASMSEQVMLGAVFAHAVGLGRFASLFPWNQRRPLSEQEKQGKILHQLAHVFSQQKNSRAAKSGLFVDKFDFIEKQLVLLKSEINEILENGQATSATLSDVNRGLDEAQKFSHEIAQHNKTLQKFERQDRALQRQSQDTEMESCSVVRYNPANKTLRREVLPIDSPKAQELAMREVWQRVGDDGSALASSFSSQQQFWQAAPSQSQLPTASSPALAYAH